MPTALNLSGLTTRIGVYALCDLDEVPIYVGQTVSRGERGINGRVRRHVTSARSDVIANRQLDVWELAYIWAWPTESAEQTNELERQVHDWVNRSGTLMAGKALAPPPAPLVKLPPYERVQVRPDLEVTRRRNITVRLPRQLFQLEQLLDVILDRKDTADLRTSLAAHFDRLHRMHEAFRTGTRPQADEG